MVNKVLNYSDIIKYSAYSVDFSEEAKTKPLELMMKDELVMSIDRNRNTYSVRRTDLLPWSLKGRIKDLPILSSIPTPYEISQYMLSIRHNDEAFDSFLASRVLSLNRENAKKLYNAIGLPQLQDEVTKAKISLICHAVSLQDNYWVRLEGAALNWSDVNLRENSLSEVVAQIALHGSSLTLTGKLTTPELTTQGTYAKAWKREQGDLWLYKKGFRGSSEARIEVMVSNILDNCNVNHLKYVAAESEDEYCCKCKCMTDENISIVSALDLYSYCNSNSLDYYSTVESLDPETIYKMWIVDYLISNSDRHGTNWGFFYNCDEMQILGCHPLFDHNNAFDRELMYNADVPYLYNSDITMRQAAHKAMQLVDFYFYREFTREDFITDRQFQSFSQRAKELGIQIKPKKPEEINVF